MFSEDVTGPASAEDAPAESAALRDAATIARRVADDESAADAERQRLQTEPLPVLPVVADGSFETRPGEVLHGQRPGVLLERHRDGHPSGGILYLTSQRLVHVGATGVEEIPLTGIRDVGVALERLLLIELADGSDLALEVDSPRLLRVHVAAARAAVPEPEASAPESAGYSPPSP